MRGRRRERLGSSVVHDTTHDPLVEQNRCQVGPTILFECPAQIPRCFLRSSSLWARHPAETSAELNVRSGAAEFFPGASRQVRRVRKRRREGNARAAQGMALPKNVVLPKNCSFCPKTPGLAQKIDASRVSRKRQRGGKLRTGSFRCLETVI